MVLTAKQEEAVKIAKEKFKRHEKYMVISGYAGSGKSTTVRFIIASLGVELEEVCYAAYTGKASEVLRKKGNPNAMTLHKLLYETTLTKEGTFIHKKVEHLKYKVVVVDECSMIPQDMVEQLAGYPGVFTIYLGDEAQLPPVDKDGQNHLLDNPDIFLDEIMRQALDSDIIRLSMKIRHHESFDNFAGHDAQVIDYEELNTGMLLWADIILCATNRTRQELNAQVRQLMGYEGTVTEGDKVICTRNYWNTFGSMGNPLINGCIGYLKRPYTSFIHYPQYMKRALGQAGTVETIESFFETDFGERYSIMADKKMLVTGQPSLTRKMEYMLNSKKKSYPLQFEYGYAITCHKSQGSEFPNVLVIEEGFPFVKEEHARWLYTAVTRASEKLVLVR